MSKEQAPRVPVDAVAVAEALLAVIFSMRPTSSKEASDAFCLSIATTALSRAILGTVGPTADATELVGLAMQQVSEQVTAAQSAHIRGALSGQKRPM